MMRNIKDNENIIYHLEYFLLILINIREKGIFREIQNTSKIIIKNIFDNEKKIILQFKINLFTDFDE